MFVDPKAVVKQLSLTEGMRVADLGAGIGNHTIPMGAAVGDSGKVYAVEVQKDFLQKIADAARKAHVRNIEPVWGDIDEAGGTKLKDASLDLVLLANTLFQLEKKEEAAKEMFRILKPRGFAAIIDWSGSYGGMGPQPADVMRDQDARELFEKVGFSHVRSLQAGTHHWGILMKKP